MKKIITLCLAIFMVFTSVHFENVQAVENDGKYEKIILGDFSLAAVGSSALVDCSTMLSQNTLITVPYLGAELTVKINDGYQVRIHSGNCHNKITSNSGWIGEDGDGITTYYYTLPLDSIYMRVSVSRKDKSEMTVEEFTNSGLEVGYINQHDIIEDNKEIVELLKNNENSVLIHLSDVHGDIIRANRAIQFSEEVDAEAVLVSGDLTAYQPDDWGSALLDVFSSYNVDVLYGIGNHDARNIKSDVYSQTIYASYYKNFALTPNGETYYYKDLAMQKLRIISVNQMEGSKSSSSGATCYSQKQIDWLINALKSTPEDYGIVLMYHSPETGLTGAAVNPNDFYQRSNRYNTPTNDYSKYTGTVLVDLIDALMMRTSINATYSEGNGSSEVIVNADFTDLAKGVEFIAHVTGHLHADSICYMPGAANQQLMLNVSCTTSMYGAQGGYANLADVSDLNRDGNSSNQDAFNAYIIDRENKTIRVLRIGANVNKDGLVRKDMTIQYSMPFEATDYPFDKEGLVQLDLEDIEWVNYGYQQAGATPTYMNGVRYTTNSILDVPYDGVTFYVKINAPYELGFRSGKTDTTMTTNGYWLNNKSLIGGYKNIGYTYQIPSGHKKFTISFGNITRNSLNSSILSNNPMNGLELALADVEIWYEPLRKTIQYDDHYDIEGKNVEIIDAGKPTSYQVGYGVKEGTLDESVVRIEGNHLVATGIGEAIVSIDGVVYNIEVETAPISLLLLIGQSNMRGSEGNANQSIVCPDGMVYSTYGDDRGESNTALTERNARQFAASALSGSYQTINVEGTTDCISGYPLNSLTEEGDGRMGPDSGFAYEWVKQTGEKVWVVNAAHGGSSITTWQKNGVNYKEAVALFKACQETLQKEIAAGHYTLSHMGYFWCQGCADNTKTAKWYVDQYLAMHENLKNNLVLSLDEEHVFEFGNIVLVQAGGQNNNGYRMGTYQDTASTYYSTFLELSMTGPRVAQLWMANNPELEDINIVSTLAQDWVTMPDGSDGVKEYFESHYENGKVDYTTQVKQKDSWYSPTKANDVKDSIHYNQIGYNEVGRESARNTLYLLGEIEDPNEEVQVSFVNWTGYEEVSEINASPIASSSTLVVPMVEPCYKGKEVSFELSEGISYDYYDLTTSTYLTEGNLQVNGANHEGVSVSKKDLSSYRFTFDGTNLVSDVSYGDQENPLKVISGKVENNTFVDLQYQLNEPILLLHNESWILEWQISDWDETKEGSFIVSDNKTSALGNNYIYVHPKNRFISIGEHNGSNHDNYGYQISVEDIDLCSGTHTYRLVNRAYEDGSNMIYLFIDGQEIGPMNRKYKGSATFVEESDFMEGKDFCFNYLGASNFPLRGMTLNYLTAFEKSTDESIHFHQFTTWQNVSLPTASNLGVQKRICESCGEEQTREIEGIWQQYDFASHYQELPEVVCGKTNLWNELTHDKEYFANGINWGIHNSNKVYSITFAVKPGDHIYASSFGKSGTNGSSTTNGIRMTYFNDYGVVKTLEPKDTYAEFSQNGYLTVPKEATYINIPMWSNADEWEVYILNREHQYTSSVVDATCSREGYILYTCLGCDDAYTEVNAPMNDQHHYEKWSFDGTSLKSTCTLCHQEGSKDCSEELDLYKGKVISVLGDSISTFDGYVPIDDGFNLYHHSRYPQSNLFMEVEKTYWMKIIDSLDAKLGINDSWRSTTVQNTYTQAQAGTFYGTKTAMSTLTRIQNLGSNGTPDIILFYGGTNDTARSSKLVAFDSSTAPTSVDLERNTWDSFTEAYSQTLLRLKHFYPETQIIALLPTYTKTYYSDTTLEKYNQVMMDICEFYDVTYIDLRNTVTSASYLPDGIHPGDEGMTLIANDVVALLLQSNFDHEVGENKVYQVSHQLTNAKASKGHYQGISANQPFEETLDGDNLSIQVFMDGQDITSSCVNGNTISIAQVTGDLEIIAQAKYDLSSHLQALPEKFCSKTNLWPLLKHDLEYYSNHGKWEVHSSGTVTSITIPVNAGERVVATSFGATSYNGIRVTYFNEYGVVKSMTSNEVYNEFTQNGYLTVPENVTAMNIPMWSISDDNEVYLLDREHHYTDWYETKIPTCNEVGEQQRDCSICGYGEVQEVTCPHKNTYSWDRDGDDVLEVLAIGNSFSIDALEHFYQIAESLGVAKIVIGNLYIGGCTLNTHYNNAMNDSASYKYYYNDNGEWKTTNRYKLSTALTSRSWDYISFQQASGYSGLESTYNTDLTGLVDYVKKTISSSENENRNPCTSFLWHMTWAYQQDSTHKDFVNYNNDQMTMYSSIASAVQNKICPLEDISIVIPSGTAVQNVRTSLVGDTVTRDGYHLSLDYGRYIAGLMFAKSILNVEITDDVYAVTGVSDVERDIAIEAVNNAYLQPFEVSASSYVMNLEDYMELNLSLTKLGFWHSTYVPSYNQVITDASNSHQFYATMRFTKEDLPKGTIIVLEKDWQYRPEGWVRDEVQTTRESPTTQSFVFVDEEWWDNYSIRAFNISLQNLATLKDKTEEEILQAFKIYVPKELHQHRYENEVTLPTCLTQGYTTYTCVTCLDSYKDHFVEALGHTLNDWMISIEPTYEHEGEGKRECLHCDYFETRPIEKLVLLGDVNHDGQVNPQDRMLLTRYLAKWTGYDNIDLKASDVNQDGKVNPEDRMILTRYLAKWSGYESLPYQK